MTKLNELDTANKIALGTAALEGVPDALLYSRGVTAGLGPVAVPNMKIFTAQPTYNGTAAGTLATWEAMLTAGGHWYFPPGDYDMTSGTPVGRVISNLTIIGVPGLSKIKVSTGTVLSHWTGDLHVEGIWFYASSQLASATIYTPDNLTSNVNSVKFINNVFDKVYTAIRATTTYSNQFVVKRLDVVQNRVYNCRGGLMRWMAMPLYEANITFNTIEGTGRRDTIGAGYGGIVCGYIQDTGAGHSPWDIRNIKIIGNTIKNIHPNADPGGTGNYGIQYQAGNAFVLGNRVERFYAIVGSATSIALGTGDGTTTTFTANTFTTNINYPTPKSIDLTVNGTQIAQDEWNNDYPGRGIFVINSSTAITASSIDYNTGAISVTFAVAPANGAVIAIPYRADTLSISDVEPIYGKSNNQQVIGNTVLDCACNQGGIALKGGGFRSTQADATYGSNVPGVAGEQFGYYCAGNTVKNTVWRGAFSLSCGYWVQQDMGILHGNRSENMTDAHINIHCAGTPAGGRSIVISDNIVTDFRGQNAIDIKDSDNGIIITNLIVDGVLKETGSVYIVRSESGADNQKAIKVKGITILDRYQTGLSIYGVRLSSTLGTGSMDVLIQDCSTSIPIISWFGKAGTEIATSRVRLRNNDLKNLTGAEYSIFAGGSQVTDLSSANSYT